MLLAKHTILRIQKKDWFAGSQKKCSSEQLRAEHYISSHMMYA